jgi:hypothetical protein
MPAHPFDASLSHVIAAGLKNIQRLNNEGKAAAVAIEVEHLIEVGGILDRCLLYYGTPRYHEADFERYWKVNRLVYKAKIDEASLEVMMTAWAFLAPDHDTFEREESEPFWDEWRKRHAELTKWQAV